ncbi:MAG: FkbM family methyltransferase [Rubrivivax sp.]
MIRQAARRAARWVTEPLRLPLRESMWRQKDKASFVRRFALVNRIDLGWPIKVSFDDDDLVVDDGQSRLSIAQTSRVALYRYGIAERLRRLEGEYLLTGVPIRSEHTVVDVGANIGEVSRLLAGRSGCRLICVEPEAEEFRCLQRNVGPFRAACHNTLLWSTEETLKFYSKNDTGDSTVFEIAGYTSVREVKATTLDRILDESGVGRVRLVKLEAEGAEPEILDGARRWLERIDYIAADLGPERGVSQESTAPAVIQRLLEAGFVFQRANAPRLVCLFMNPAAKP